MRPQLLTLLPAVAAAAVLGLAGCSDKTAGSATPGEETPTEQSTPTTDETTTSSEPENSLAEVNPCELLTADGVAQLGLTGGEEDKFGEARVCVWRHEGSGADDSYTVQTEIFEQRGIADVVGTNLQPTSVNGRAAVVSEGSTGGCAVSLEVTDSSRVDATAVGGEFAGACTLATDLANLIEPKLP